jgi:hypothetical protein
MTYLYGPLPSAGALGEPTGTKYAGLPWLALYSKGKSGADSGVQEASVSISVVPVMSTSENAIAFAALSMNAAVVFAANAQAAMEAAMAAAIANVITASGSLAVSVDGSHSIVLTKQASALASATAQAPFNVDVAASLAAIMQGAAQMASSVVTTSQQHAQGVFEAAINGQIAKAFALTGGQASEADVGIALTKAMGVDSEAAYGAMLQVLLAMQKHLSTKRDGAGLLDTALVIATTLQSQAVMEANAPQQTALVAVLEGQQPGKIDAALPLSMHLAHDAVSQAIMNAAYTAAANVVMSPSALGQFNLALANGMNVSSAFLGALLVEAAVSVGFDAAISLLPDVGNFSTMAVDLSLDSQSAAVAAASAALLVQQTQALILAAETRLYALLDEGALLGTQVVGSRVTSSGVTLSVTLTYTANGVVAQALAYLPDGRTMVVAAERRSSRIGIEGRHIIAGIEPRSGNIED